LPGREGFAILRKIIVMKSSFFSPVRRAVFPSLGAALLVLAAAVAAGVYFLGHLIF